MYQPRTGSPCHHLRGIFFVLLPKINIPFVAYHSLKYFTPAEDELWVGNDLQRHVDRS